MILIDALFINNGGGKVLLDYLIFEIQKTNMKVFYLLDDRISNDKSYNNLENKVFIKATLYNRFMFYYKNTIQFKTILCFANMPLLLRSKSIVYTYFHQRLYLDLPSDISFFNKLIFNLKSSFVKILKNNTNFWIVQNNNMKDLIINKYALSREIVLVFPFFKIDSEYLSINFERGNNFLYISNASNHKNHLRLIEAFKLFYKKYNIGELWLTIYDNPVLLNIIEKEVNCGLPIKNLGYIKPRELAKIYKQCKFVIFPSLSESFGLGLIEGIEYGCDIIASDLPYTYEICNPSIIFDPLSVNSIQNSFEIAINGNYNKTIPIVRNKIDSIINILQND